MKHCSNVPAQEKLFDSWKIIFIMWPSQVEVSGAHMPLLFLAQAPSSGVDSGHPPQGVEKPQVLPKAALAGSHLGCVPLPCTSGSGRRPGRSGQDVSGCSVPAAGCMPGQVEVPWFGTGAHRIATTGGRRSSGILFFSEEGMASAAWIGNGRGYSSSLVLL